MNLNRVKQQFYKLSKALPPIGCEGVAGSKRLTSHIVDYSVLIHGRLSLEADCADRFRTVFDEIASEVLPSGTWGRESLLGLIAESAAEVVAAPPGVRDRAIRDEAQKIIAALSEPPRCWQVEIAVGGLLPDCSGLKFGSLTFVLQTVDARLPIAALTGSQGTIEAIFGQLSVTASDKNSALSTAESIVDHELSVLNALIADSPPSLFRVHRGQPKDLISYEIERVFAADAIDPHMRFGSHRIGYPLSGVDFEARMNARKGARVNELLMRKDSFARRISNGYSIAGAACTEQSPQLSFLLFAIALESSLLGPQAKTEITYQLSARIAHLLATSLDKRRALFQRISSLYRMRSQLVHNGVRDVTKGDIQAIWQICMYSLHALATHAEFEHMMESEALDGWFEDRMLGATP